MQHLDEGTIHAWLDGQLPSEEADAIEAHVAECRECAGAVAEARGLIAASSRILTALDGVPRDVAPKQSPTIAAADDASPTTPSAAASASPRVAVSPASRASQRARRRWLSGPSLAAAATILVAVGTLTLMRASERGSGPRMTAQNAGDRSGTRPLAAPSMDSQVAAFSAPTTTPRPAPPAPSVVGTTANEASPANPAAARTKALADGAGAAGSASADMSGARARADSPTLLRQQASQKKPQDEAESRRELSKVIARDVAATPPARPRLDSVTAQVFRGASAAEQRFSALAAPGDSSAKAPATGSIRGRVVDGNNTGLAGAMVRVEGTSIGVTTAGSGEFDLRGVPAGPQRLRVIRLGFEPSTRTVTVGAGAAASVDFTLTPASLTLNEVVVTGTAAQGQAGARDARARTPARASPTPAPAPAAPAPAEVVRAGPTPSAYGCYELGITPTSTQARSGFREVPRRIALDSVIVPSRSDGVWYQVRDLAGAMATGVWRPAGPETIEAQWSYGSRTATIRLTGSSGSMMRGNIEEIDRATAHGEAGAVVAVRRSCDG